MHAVVPSGLPTVTGTISCTLYLSLICFNLLPDPGNIVFKGLNLCIDFIDIIEQRVVGILESIERLNQLVNILNACSKQSAQSC